MSRITVKLPDSEHSATLTISPNLTAGPSSAATVDAVSPKNGRMNGNGFDTLTPSITNGTSSGLGVGIGKAAQKHGKSIAKVNLPGTMLYEDSYVNREEFVRLVIQSLRDVGYIESAATLEAESGYTLEAPEVTRFRQYILDGLWPKAEAALQRLGVEDDGKLWDAKFLISRQKYLELLEAKKTTAALHVLRNELAPLGVDSEQLHTLSSLIMCSEPEDLRTRAEWDGASGTSRRRLLDDLHDSIPSSVMIPQRRFSSLLHQARAYQYQQCVYHNSPTNSSAFSLYSDHRCNQSDFPRVTTTILEIHTDEVWNIEWSHDGAFLASASKDKTAIIWRAGSTSDSGQSQDWTAHFTLKDHLYPVGCLAWSLDDSILLTSSEQYIKMWNTKTGTCLRTLEQHTDTVSALSWLPDGSGFISGGMDRQIIRWDADGRVQDSWPPAAIRITDMAVTPDFTRLVTIGLDIQTPPASTVDVISSRSGGQHGEATPQPASGNVPAVAPRNNSNRMIVFDLSTKEQESSIHLEGDLTSLKVSQNSQYALINHAPDEIHLWDLNAERLARKYTGQRQGHHVIRSCFGGIDGNFVVSGSEDANVYVWHQATGALLEILSGHGEGSVNSVSWNPRNPRMFASCSDDRTIRIWEATRSEMAEHTSLRQLDHPSAFNGKGKGKTRQRWDGDGVDFGSGSESARV